MSKQNGINDSGKEWLMCGILLVAMFSFAAIISIAAVTALIAAGILTFEQSSQSSIYGGVFVYVYMMLTIAVDRVIRPSEEHIAAKLVERRSIAKH